VASAGRTAAGVPSAPAAVLLPALGRRACGGGEEARPGLRGLRCRARSRKLITFRNPQLSLIHSLAKHRRDLGCFEPERRPAWLLRRLGQVVEQGANRLVVQLHCPRPPSACDSPTGIVHNCGVLAIKRDAIVPRQPQLEGVPVNNGIAAMEECKPDGSDIVARTPRPRPRPEIVMLFGLARRTARQIEKVSPFYIDHGRVHDPAVAEHGEVVSAGSQYVSLSRKTEAGSHVGKSKAEHRIVPTHAIVSELVEGLPSGAFRRAA